MMFAAGMLIIAETTGRVLLLKRADGEGWATPAGMLEPGERGADAARRELDEETGFSADLTTFADTHLLVRLGDGDVMSVPWQEVYEVPDDATLIYEMFVCTVREQFEPTLNAEHTEWMWARPLPGPHLHPGADCAIRWLMKEYG